MDEIFQHNAEIVFHFLYSMCRDVQIAKNLLYQHWTRYKKYSLVELDELLEAESNTEGEVINRMELSDIWDKVQSLSGIMKQVVELRILSDLSYKKIGQMLGKSENWERVTFHRAKLILVKDSE